MIWPPWPWSLALSWETNSQAEIFNSLGFQFWGNVLSWPLVTENKMSHSLPQPKRQGGGETNLSPWYCKIQCVRHCPEAASLHLIKLIGLIDCQTKSTWFLDSWRNVRVEETDKARKQIEATTAVWSTNTSELGQTCFFRIGKWSCLHCWFCLSAEAECT